MIIINELRWINIIIYWEIKRCVMLLIGRAIGSNVSRLITPIASYLVGTFAFSRYVSRFLTLITNYRTLGPTSLIIVTTLVVVVAPAVVAPGAVAPCP